jgi:hypothetical protein
VSLGCGGPNSAVGELANENVDSVLDDRPAVKMGRSRRVPWRVGHRDHLVDVDVDPVIGVTLGGVDRLGVSVVDTLIDIPLQWDDFNRSLSCLNVT